MYLARHTALGKKCALKVIPPDHVTEIGWQRCQLEARAVAKLDHKNLVRVTDLGIHEGCFPYYAMDCVEGKNLAELLTEQGPMPHTTVLEVFMQVCDGVECAHHSGILHRDLKPANIMLVTGKGAIKQAKILDFGLAKLTRPDRLGQSLTAMGDIFGSPFYMSPFPASLEIVVAKLLRKNPVERYQTISELRIDLEKVAKGEDETITITRNISVGFSERCHNLVKVNA